MDLAISQLMVFSMPPVDVVGGTDGVAGAVGAEASAPTRWRGAASRSGKRTSEAEGLLHRPRLIEMDAIESEHAHLGGRAARCGEAAGGQDPGGRGCTGFPAMAWPTSRAASRLTSPPPRAKILLCDLPRRQMRLPWASGVSQITALRTTSSYHRSPFA